MIKLKKEVEKMMRDFGFIDPDEAISQLMKLFDVKQEDINYQNLHNVYDVHYGDYVLKTKIEGFKFTLIDILPYDISF